MSSKPCLTSDEINESQYVTTPYQSGWADVTRSEHWFVRSLLLTLCSLVPILNWCIGGFATRWGRELCLGVNRRLPSTIVDDDTFISGAKIWFVNLCWVLVLALAAWLFLLIPVAGPILVALMIVAYVFVSPLLNFQVALSSKFTAGFTGVGRAFSLLFKKPIKTLGSTFAPVLVVNVIVGVFNVVVGGVLLVLVASSLISVVSEFLSNFTSTFFSGGDWQALITTFLTDFDSVFTVSAYAFFVLYFIFKLAGVIANLWTYRSIGHFIAREGAEWLTEEELVDTSCLEAPASVVQPYIPFIAATEAANNTSLVAVESKESEGSEE